MRPPRRSAGFTIAELLVSMVILGIVTSMTFAVMGSVQTSYTENQDVADTQEDARLLTEMVLSDVRMAGFLVPRSAAIASRDGGAAAPDVLCVSDPGIMAEARIQAATNYFDRAIVQTTVGSGASSVQLVASTMDVDGDGDGDFGPGDGIIIADDADSHCARITTMAGGNVFFSPRTPPGFDVSGGAGRAVPARIYEIAGTTLTRDGLPLSDQVENLQLEFFVDADTDGTMDAGEFPVHSLAGSDAALVRSVRISVVTRTAQPDPENPGVGMPAVANHAGAAPDGLTRRRYETMVVPRNLLD
jgi:prepilin-type N-terminal cleavage/methylation domain-containing protein